MRIIAGQFRSRRLQSIAGLDVRPTSDRLRETLFNVLTSGDADRLQGKSWLDLYAGTGAVGIEALSRGSKKVFFVERSRRMATVIEKNLASLAVETDRREILVEKALTALDHLQSRDIVCDYCFLDPPYQLHDQYAIVLERLSTSSLLGKAGVLIVEHHPKFDPGEQFNTVKRYRLLRQGDAALSFYRRSQSGLKPASGTTSADPSRDS
jgi:16S rRNA (guanine966-N2)-methyltransferase